MKSFLAFHQKPYFMYALLLCFFSASFINALSQTTITGTVNAENNNPLTGVSVQVRGSTRGVVTDAAGHYSIAANAPDVLTFSFVGYATQEITVGPQTSINVTLVSSASELQSVVVVGYGTQRRIDVTGSVAQVNGADISKQSSINPVSSLQGRVAGVQITNAGAPGSSPEIRIRGLGTVYGDPNPLYVVDGVWFSDVSFLNPNDIQDISILKDASAEAIYGIRAANGVVLITTKRGKNGKTNINYNSYAGFQHITNQIDMADGSEYAQLINEKGIYSTGDSVLANPSQFGNGTNWYDQILRSAFITNHQIAVNGGSEKANYNFSLGYLDQDGLVKTNNYKRITASLQSTFKVFPNLTVGYTIVSSGSKTDSINPSIFHDIYAAPPILAVKTNDSSYGDPATYNLGQAVSNPQAILDFTNLSSKTYRFTGNFFVDLKFLKYFTFHTSFGGEIGETEIRGYAPEYFATSTQSSQFSLLNVIRNETRNYIIENTLNFTNRFGDHNVTVLLGQGAQRYRFYQLNGSAYNVPNSGSGDLYLRLASVTNSKGDTTVTNGLPYSVTDAGDISTISSYFARVNYSFADKYLINASIRADGSSKFFGDQRWGYFPSVGIGWVISNENFMSDQNIFKTLKIRGSWGKIGNASVPSNLSVLTVTQGGYLTGIFGNLQTPYTGASITTIVPPTTYWERSNGTDIGLDAGFLNNILTLTADIYRRKTERAIFGIPILGSIGTSGSTIVGNQASFKNEGIELTIAYNNRLSKNFTYNISINGSLNNNKVLDVSTGANPIYSGGAGATGGALITRTVLGSAIGEFYGYEVTGIFQTQADVDKSPQAGTAKPGDFIYADVDGDGSISGNDRVVLGNPNPKYIYGINTAFTYKEFDLTVDLQGVAHADIYNANAGLRYGNENYTKDFYNNRWHGEGTSNSYPSANIGGNQNYLPNSFFVESGSYFRIRNLQLGYTLPSTILSRWSIQQLRVYANAQNPFNFFKYRGFSPEVGGTPTNAGIDLNVYPLYATYNFGVNLTF